VQFHFPKRLNREIDASLFSMSESNSSSKVVMLSMTTLCIFFLNTMFSIIPPPSSSIVFTFSGEYSKNVKSPFFSSSSRFQPNAAMFSKKFCFSSSNVM